MLSKTALERASEFYRRRRNDPAVAATFGYFTNHPVAALNGMRLEMILDKVGSLALGTSLRVLDIACGGGLIAAAVAAMGHQVAAVDLSSDELRVARQFAEEQALNVAFLEADVVGSAVWREQVVRHLGAKPQIVTLAYALHHLPDVEHFIADLVEWLPDRAALIINEENPLSPLFQLKHRIRTAVQHDTDIECHRKPTEWQAMLKRAGLRITQGTSGADMVPLLSRIAPGLCWSVVFVASK